jgi:deazaflavin-dependent oxidoreductase (nitroreductase family)
MPSQRRYRPGVPSDLVLKTMNNVHRTILKVSGGRIGWTAGDMPVLELTTTGRKSGQPRSVMLTSPLQEDDTMVIVASRGGDDQHPAWFLNLRDHPEVTVKLKDGPPRTMMATAASEDERDRMWPIIAGKYKNYAGYQTKTDRQIPLVLLTPA